MLICVSCFALVTTDTLLKSLSLSSQHLLKLQPSLSYRPPLITGGSTASLQHALQDVNCGFVTTEGSRSCSLSLSPKCSLVLLLSAELKSLSSSNAFLKDAILSILSTGGIFETLFDQKSHLVLLISLKMDCPSKRNREGRTLLCSFSEAINQAITL